MNENVVRMRRLLVQVAAAAVLVSCGGSDISKPISLVIPAAGGTLNILGGLVVLTVPSGAVATDQSITATLASSPPGGALLVTGTAVDLEPASLTFSAPISMAIDVSALSLPTGVLPGELRLSHVVNGVWTPIAGSAYSAANNTVTGNITGFGTYGLVAVPVASVSVTPKKPSVAVGNTVAMSAALKDASNASLPSRVVSWSSATPSVASVSTAGVVTGKAAGTTIIMASAEGISDTTTVTVTAPGGGTPTPWREDDYSTYTSTLNFLLNPRGIYEDMSAPNDGNTVFGRANILLDSTTGFGALTKSLLFNIPARTSLTGCTDFSVGVNLNLPTPTTEVWIEVVSKTTTGFTTRAPAAWACASNPDYKFIFGRTTPSGRFNLMLGTGGNQFTFGYPGNEDNEYGMAPANPFDGSWHTYRFHLKVGSGTGQAQFWYDGILNKSFSNVTTTATSIYGVALGRNLNQGPGVSQGVWIGRVRVWNTDPGF